MLILKSVRRLLAKEKLRIALTDKTKVLQPNKSLDQIIHEVHIIFTPSLQYTFLSMLK